ncbi:MAG: MOSC domain-containing protein [Cyclobacteriaceae bacterium]|nr:MOSC domain-containing protein [Cyclobacteriaceae bacterium]
MSNLRLSEIWIYPIKSLRGISLEKATVLEKGLASDRRWMLADERNKFITQREHPELALFSVSLADNHIHILHRKNNESVSFSTEVPEENVLQTTIWNDTVTTIEPWPEISAWFTNQLNFRCKLVHFPESNSRLVDTQYANNNENVSLADGYPFLIIGQSSLDDLNKRLQEPLPIRRFRPNFVFTGGEPYEEERWRNFSIGTVEFAGVKNCARCVLTTVDPETGIKGKEPLLTLSKYRKHDNKILFGQNVVLRKPGVVQVGDEISVASS